MGQRMIGFSLSFHNTFSFSAFISILSFGGLALDRIPSLIKAEHITMRREKKRKVVVSF